MLIRDVERIKDFGTNLFDKKRPNKIIDEIVELPLRKACKIFWKKGVQTVMSSANKTNVMPRGMMTVEKEDVKGREIFYPAPTFFEAGKGYAWIMLNFDTLSNKNKDWLFSLEERKNEKGENIGEKAVWFVHPYAMGNIDYKIRSGQYTYEYLRSILSESEIPQGIERDDRLAKFEEKCVILAYNDRYPSNSVILRMPVDGRTTVKEVEDYFVSLARSFNKQHVIKRVKEGFSSQFAEIGEKPKLREKIKAFRNKFIKPSTELDERED